MSNSNTGPHYIAPHQSNYPQASTYLDYIQNRRGKQAKPQRQLFDAADEKMKRIHDIVWQVGDTNVPVLITGESGTGKEVIARALHEAAFEDDRPYIAVNCAAMPASLLESELFGFEKGAFTGAHQRHVGKFELASNGTLLLDEITEMDLSLQAKLLRVLQEKEIDPLGSKSPVRINTRIIATTNRDIVKAVAQGKFRQDLYYRLYVLHIEVPPLRERPKDIVLLAQKFLETVAISFQRPQLRFSEQALAKLCTHTWPGNVRELQNIIQRAVIHAPQDMILPEHIPIDGEEMPSSMEWVSTLPIGQTLQLVETHFILETLKHHNGNRTHAAKTLGISLRTLRNKINEFTVAGYEVPAPLSGRANS
ncbi:MAG: sigma-54-dependent Fis family transcriptional regulator [Deltaproteobacteria bacterium]|nr:sigma-54-dependent Fis family transcriptional regulator [Deltaproteobacteria bacterium]